MVKKLALASLFFAGGSLDATASLSSPPSISCASTSTATSWQWPSRGQARTMSFGRVDGCRDGEVSSTRRDCKTRVITNPAYCGGHSDHSFVSATEDSASTTASERPPTMPSSVASEMDEVIIRGIRSSSRLFFEPEATSSIMRPAAFDGATALAVDSADPYGDFRRSMEEMVLSHGGGDGEDDWGWLEEMLGWYLKANGRKNHGLIVGAFVDLLVAITSGKKSDEC